jgi:anti-sigma factor RsiW
VSIDGLPEDLLSAYVDGECDAEERGAVEERVAGDPEWRAILEDVRAAKGAVQGLPHREPPAGFVDGLTEFVTEYETEHDRGQRRGWRAAIAGLTAAAAILAGFLLASPSGRDTRVAPAIATLADSHGAAAALQSDPVTGLAPIAVTPDLEP